MGLPEVAISLSGTTRLVRPCLCGATGSLRSQPGAGERIENKMAPRGLVIKLGSNCPFLIQSHFKTLIFFFHSIFGALLFSDHSAHLRPNCTPPSPIRILSNLQDPFQKHCCFRKPHLESLSLLRSDNDFLLSFLLSSCVLTHLSLFYCKHSLQPSQKT